MVRRAGEMEVEVRERMRDGKGSVQITHILKREELKGRCRLCAKMSLEPGASVGLHRHDDEEEIYYITRGKGLVNDNGSEKEVVAGDVVLTPDGEEHSIENIGDEPLEFTAVILLYS